MRIQKLPSWGGSRFPIQACKPPAEGSSDRFQAGEPSPDRTAERLLGASASLGVGGLAGTIVGGIWGTLAESAGQCIPVFHPGYAVAGALLGACAGAALWRSFA